MITSQLPNPKIFTGLSYEKSDKRANGNRRNPHLKN